MKKSYALQLNVSFFIFTVLISFYSFANPRLARSLASDDIPYATYRDFALNKGAFYPGARDVNIYNKRDELVGVLNKAPMPDFSSVDYLSGVTTLIHPQYAATVTPNSASLLSTLNFGHHTYQMVERESVPEKDFNILRLNKLVTDVAPAETLSAEMNFASLDNEERFPVFYRIGSGQQKIMDETGQGTDIQSAYRFLTGGTIGRPVFSPPDELVTNSGNVFDPVNGPLANHGAQGDSGSPLFAWDSHRNHWVIAGALNFIYVDKPEKSVYSIVAPEFIEVAIQKYTSAIIGNTNKNDLFFWRYDKASGVGNLIQGASGYLMQGLGNALSQTGKDLVFNGAGGVILLQDSVNQGAGSLTFNNDYTVSSPLEHYWVGGGVNVAPGATVTWQVNGIAGDNLHKVGKGTLKINGTGINPGGLNAGDGTVYLAQTPDNQGRVQAFKSVHLASGRPLVVLYDGQQVDPDSISWGFRGGKLDVNGNSLTFHRLNAADYGAELINRDEKRADITLSDQRSTDGFIFHGQLQGNLNFHNEVAIATEGALVLDGAVNIAGDVTQKNGRLVFQGHPVVHAFNLPETVDKLKSLKDNSLRTDPVSFDQTDWQKRTFRLNNLILENTAFDLARNASLVGNINAKGSVITLGSPSLYIDLKEGNGVESALRQGTSIASRYDELSWYHGNTRLTAGSELTIREIFTGRITGHDSKVTVASRYATFNGYSVFNNTPLTLELNAKLKAYGGWTTNAPVTVGPTASLFLAGTPAKGNQFRPAIYAMNKKARFELKEGSDIHVLPFVFLKSNIHSVNPAMIRFGDDDNSRLADDLSPAQKRLAGELAGFKNAWRGSIHAPHARLGLKSTRWEVRGDSQVNKMRVSRSLVGMSGGKFHTLTVRNLQADKTGFVLRADRENSDKIVVRDSATGQNNRLFIDIIKNPVDGKMAIPLIIAPANTNVSLFKINGPVSGFNQLHPIVNVVQTADKTQWILEGFKFTPNAAAVATAKRFLDMGYRQLITEVNNLDKRLEDLRDMQAQDGAWGHTENGSGAGRAGYADRYTALQTGFDKKRRWSGTDLFTGVLMSHTRTDASGVGLRGNTRAFGAGLYAEAKMDSGAYINAIGKVIHSFDVYQTSLTGPAPRNHTSRTVIGSVGSGYRYHLNENFYIEPQAGLVFSTLSATRLKWNDNGITVSLRHQNATPLIGRTGVTTGKHFTGRSWTITARAGLNYQFDLLRKGETALRDISGEHRFAGKRDQRVLYHAALDGQLSENLRFGLEMERSVFGNDGVNHAINANMRYRF